MNVAQPGIFAVGTAAHCYLELDRGGTTDAGAVVRAIAALEEPHTTVGGVNVVVGVRPSLWAAAVPQACPTGAADFDRPVRGPDGFTMPATQHDALVWIAGAAPDLVFDVATTVVGSLRPVARLASEVTGWSYRHSRDLTGFEDGTENPPIAAAYQVAVVAAGERGEGSSMVLVQKWVHDAAAWSALTVAEQEAVMGRTKADSLELDEAMMPATSHVARTVIEQDGEELEIFRRNTPYGTVSEHGTMFVGFSADQGRLARMLERMAGAEDGVRDALTRYTTALTGAYYVCPPLDVLRNLASPRR